MYNITSDFSNKIVSALEAVRYAIKDNDHIVFGHAIAAPESISKAIYDLRENFSNLEIFHMLYIGEPWHMKEEMKGHTFIKSNFFDAYTRKAKANKQVDFLPCHFHELPELFSSGLYRVDVAAIQVSYPDENGYCSFGVSCDYTSTAAKVAKITIAEMNKQMPYLKGDNLIHISELDYIVEVNRPLKEIPVSKIGDTEKRIGELCATLIPNGATLQLGIGGIPDAVLNCLNDHKDLGIHTEMFTDGVMNMFERGIITGKKKTLHPNKIVTTLVMGSKKLYDFLDNNEVVELYPVSYTNDPYIIAQNDNMIAINSCLEIDLFGQVVSESIGEKQFSGTGGQVDFLRGTKRSNGGISILAFPSTAYDGTISRIIPKLKEGSTVTTMRNDIDYIVTEYGIAHLRGKSLYERAISLKDIAHPNFRRSLEDYIKTIF